LAADCHPLLRGGDLALRLVPESILDKSKTVPGDHLELRLTLLQGTLVLLLGVMAGPVPAQTSPQDSYHIEAWQNDEGLPQGSAVALAQTRDGYLWVGTFGGLARFDGLRFRVFDTTTIPELPGNAITALHETEDGTLLVGTATGGIAALRAGRFERILENQQEGDDIVAIIKDRSGATLLSCLSGVLWRWADGKITRLNGRREPGYLRFGPIHPGVLCQDHRGGLWSPGANGQLRYSAGAEWQSLDLAKELGGSTCQALARDAKGGLWLGTSRGLAYYEQGVWQIVKAPGLPDDLNIDDAYASRDGGVWLACWNGEECVFRKFKQGQPPLQVTNVAPRAFGVYPLGEDAHGGLCLGSVANGFYRISTNGTVLHLDRRHGLPGNSVRCYLLDREGNEWLGLDDGGLVRLRPRTIGVLDSAPGAQVAIHSVCEDHEGIIWAGSSSEGLFRGEAGKLRRYDVGENPELRSIWAVFEDRQHTLWVGTFGDGLFRRAGDRFEPAFDAARVERRVRAIFEDSRGRLWLGCRAGLAFLEQGHLTVLPRPPVQGDFEARCVAEDRQGRIWAGTLGQGLFCWEQERWTNYRRSQGLGNDNIASLYVDAEGMLWVGTAGGGLSRGSGTEFVTIGTEAGLPDETICHIAEDRHGNFWFSSSQGVFSARKSDLDAFLHGIARSVPCIIYGRSDGLPTRECMGGTAPAGWTTHDGRLLIPTMKGVAVVQPNAVEFNAKPPPIYIEELRVEGTSPHPSQSATSLGALLKATVPPGKSRLSIFYTALSLTAPEKVRFRVKLTPLEADWVEKGTQREVQYSFLSPGNYEFQVMACNNDGVWNNQPAKLDLTVLPRFWQTGWFTVGWIGALTGSVAGGVAYGLRRRHQRRIEKLEQLRVLEKERARIARDIHDDLGSSLTEIGLLGALAVRDGTPPAETRLHVNRIMERTHELARTLDETVWALNPKNDWLGRLAIYLCQFTKEFLEPTSIACRLDVAADLPEVPLAAEVRHNLFLVVKEALHNAVRHSAASRVWLRMAVQDQEFMLEVEDNGRGFVMDENLETGNGLRNMSRRMEELGGRFEVRSAPGKGTAVGLRLPLPDDDGRSSSGGDQPTQLGDGVRPSGQ